MTRNMVAVVAVLAGVVLAAAPRGAAAQAAAGERFQAQPAPAVQTLPAPAIATAAAPEAAEPTAVERYGPTAEGAKLLAPAKVAADEPRLAHAPAYRSREGIPLMIVGGALFLAGAIIGDRAGDAVMVGGVVVAAIGLYEYLQ